MKGLVVWLTGLPSSGKSTLAEAAAARLRAEVPSVVLDGDAVRAALRPTPAYDEAARAAFYETLGNLAALLARQGLVVLVAATAHRRGFREFARQQAPAFLEVYVDTPADVCRARDTKGLYASTHAEDLPGTIATPYEPPLTPALVIDPQAQDGPSLLAALVRRATG